MVPPEHFPKHYLLSVLLVTNLLPTFTLRVPERQYIITGAFDELFD
jgi:hypothetical protein